MAIFLRGVSEETFLKTPFYDGSCKSGKSFKFEDARHPGIAMSEVIDINTFKNIQVDQFYSKVEVR